MLRAASSIYIWRLIIVLGVGGSGAGFGDI